MSMQNLQWVLLQKFNSFVQILTVLIGQSQTITTLAAMEILYRLSGFFIEIDQLEKELRLYLLTDHDDII